MRTIHLTIVIAAALVAFASTSLTYVVSSQRDSAVALARNASELVDVAQDQASACFEKLASCQEQGEAFKRTIKDICD